MLNQGESPAEFFDYKHHPFADTYRLKNTLPWRTGQAIL